MKIRAPPARKVLEERQQQEQNKTRVYRAEGETNVMKQVQTKCFVYVHKSQREACYICLKPMKGSVPTHSPALFHAARLPYHVHAMLSVVPHICPEPPILSPITITYTYT